MPSLETPPPPSSRNRADIFEMPRKIWTRDECHHLMETGILEEGRYELLEGEIVIKMGQNEPHIYVCGRMLRALVSVFGFDFVRIPAPLAIDDYNEPEPDVSVTTRPARDYLTSGTPEPQDIRLAVEVADSTLRSDLRVKSSLYARAGIVEYWVVDINARCVHVHREPTAEGYESITVVGVEGTLTPLAAPQTSLPVVDLLP
jgi:Uma2 family endonuclease